MTSEILDWEKCIKPQSTSEILGNANVINDVKNYIKEKGTEQVLLIQGPPGVGKTTAINLALTEMNYKPIQLYISGEHTLKSIETLLQKCAGSRSILDWGVKRNFALVVDELECLQIFQKQILIRLLQIHSPTKGIPKTSKKKLEAALRRYVPLDMPVIFICNVGYHRSLEEIEKHAEKFIFNRPTLEEQYIWCQTVAMIHDIRITKNVLHLIIEKALSDIRQLSSFMFLVYQQQKAGNNLVKIRKMLRHSGEKQEDKHLYDRLHNIISKTTELKTAMSNYEYETILLPWMIFENSYKYLDNAHFDCSEDIGKISNMISECDLIWEASHGRQCYELDNYYAVTSVWAIPYTIRKKLPQHLLRRPTFTFPSIMIKRSQIKLHESYNEFLLNSTNSTPIEIHYSWQLIKKLPLDLLVKLAEDNNLEYIEIDRIEKLANFSNIKELTNIPKTNWTATFKKNLKKELNKSV